jgi:uncharacterized protein YggT (Ycf19 family)
MRVGENRGSGEVVALRVSRILVVFLYGLVVAAIVIMVIAFFLQLFSANQSAPFVQWIYRSADVVMAPFRGIFPRVEAESGSVFDVSILFAILMYGLFAMGIHALIAWLQRKILILRMGGSFWDEQALPAPPSTPSAGGPSIRTPPS